LLKNNPTLAEAVLSDDPTLLTSYLIQQQMQKKAAEVEQMKQIEALNADPFNIEAQQKIAEAIRMENVNDNMEHAIEHHPEAFARVEMLYIDCVVNNTPVKAFVDSGAQSTIMSVKCAERCG
jgi:DNA damage-inducible protein 1